MVRQLLSIGREETGRRVLSLNKVAEEVCKLLSRLIPENIRLEVRCSRDLGKACADSLEIQRVLLNLVLNARDAMPGGGRIRITLRNLAVGEKVARTHPEVPSGDYVCLQVTDTGCGMEEHSHAHLFEPFFTTKPVGQGNGVGLNTVLGIVHRSGGRILVESRVGKGTRIRVLLPRVRAEVATLKEYGKEEFSEFRSQIRKGRGTVLLVEDNTTVRRSIRRVLREQGYEVLAARNGTHALGVARSHPGAIDLLLTDVVMPGISGPELGSKLRDWQPAMRVIHMSAYGSGDLDEAVFLRKPFTREALAQKLAEVLGRSHVVPHQEVKGGDQSRERNLRRNAC
jgi:two-component system cell cycle sensor histidine kinase/response regulator CckA